VPEAWKRHALLAWSCVLSGLILAPLLTPGYVLHLDMVFVPEQTLLPWNLGIGAGLPRSVPQDALVSLMAGPLPGQLVQKVVLTATFVLAGVGAGRLAGGRRWEQLAAASLYLWSAYVAARLLMGHWGLLWAYALLPWVVLGARRARRTGSVWLVVFLCGAGALVPTGGIVLALAGLPLALGPGSKVRPAMRWVGGLLVLLLNAPWWLPAVRSPVAEVSDPLGMVVFGARADGPGGVVGSVLAGGGVWNSQATLGSRTTWFALLAALVLAGLAVLGWSRWFDRRRAEAAWMGLLGVAGVGWAWLSGVAGEQGWAQALVGGPPGGGLLRDGQKWTVFWVLVVAVCAPAGLSRLSRRAVPSLQVFLAASLALLPLAALPDLAWGAFGRLRPVDYPKQWGALRSQLATAPGSGDVLSLPWAAFRRYPWNHAEVVLDPLPRFLTRTVVWNDQLPVTVDGQLVKVGGDDPRAAAVDRAIGSGRALAPVLAGLGIRWIVVQTDQPDASRPPDLAGTSPVWAQEGLELREVDGQVRPYRPSDALVVAVDVLAAVTLVGSAAMAMRGRGGEDGQGRRQRIT